MQTAITSDLIYSLSVRQFICYGGINRLPLSLSLSLFQIVPVYPGPVTCTRGDA